MNNKLLWELTAERVLKEVSDSDLLCQAHIMTIEISESIKVEPEKIRPTIRRRNFKLSSFSDVDTAKTAIAS
ncbi:hypothetical protein [Vibrio crassostreae]|uniref:hypothetical protein n=1 Tax=Vibrio crassostreae TaxID=246167 RepID=UPI000F473625|nr:hypothetical protein [Vibrio crassostreae]ROO54097.1 hypothetical protein EDB56_104101 [Vibrio crassostreae]ROO70998.1 hypothetical protein EDB53_3122 [Vibrio crassostreae]ROR68905.1 hypothetical protein EDB54_2562 [Vibrio crassostreae]ROR79247.1 hypothetical protein EDB55_3111 [Vibrio crassostreae]TCN95175.1 hypothetical protein EDB50_103101 [Vibrio crassostreae]